MIKNFILLAGIFLIKTGYSLPADIILVENGETDYSIYVHPSEPASVGSVANELQMYFEKVSGASPLINQNEAFPATPYISLGSISAAAAGLDTSGIPLDGFRMVSQGNNIFIFGPDTPDGETNGTGGVYTGTRNGVYTFIEDFLGLHWVMPGTLGEEYEEVTYIQVPAMDSLYVSPFERRMANMPRRYDQTWYRRQKLGEPAVLHHGHSWTEIIPPSLFEEHPDWFAQKDGEPITPVPPYYKLETTNQVMVKYFANKLIENFRADPDLWSQSMSASDGGGGWSDSPATLALLEKDPYGYLSRTPLMLKFYNDVAKIVGEEFPDRKLGAYLYGDYRWPPSSDLSIEPNIVLMLVGTANHYSLYRTDDNLYSGHSNRELNDEMMRRWAELADTYGFDLHFYGYPIWMAYNEEFDNLFWPPSPENLNFLYCRLDDLNFHGAYFYGNPWWPGMEVGNYIHAKLFWNPKLDANQVKREFLEMAYGHNAAPYLDSLFSLLDEAFSDYYNRHLSAGSRMSVDHLNEIYAPNYSKFEGYYLKAYDEEKKLKQQERLELLGGMLSGMKNTFINHGVYLDSLIGETGFEVNMTIVNKSTGEPVNRATVSYGDYSAGSNSAGSVVITDIEKGEWKYTINHNAYYPVSGSLMISSDTSLIVELTSKLASILINVSDSAGPVPDASVSLNTWEKFTDNEGNVSYSNQPSRNTYPYIIQAEGYEVVADSFYLELDTTISILILLSTTGLEDNTSMVSGVFPNPANGMLNIQSASSNSMALLLKTDGKLLVKKKLVTGPNQIDVSSINPGIYILRIQSSENEENHKVVLN